MRGSRSKALIDITLVSRCKKVVLAFPNTSSGGTTAYATQVATERANSVWFYWLAQLTSILGQDPLSQKMVPGKKDSSMRKQI